MILADIHLHTHFSHGQNSVREMFTAARERGLRIQGFSEHSPRPVAYAYPSEYRDRLQSGFGQYLTEVRQLANEQAARPDGIKILLGLELDWLEAEPDFMRQVLTEHEFDYVIGGIHFLGKWGFDFCPEEWAGYDQAALRRIYADYYQTMIKMAQSGLFHYVAHPDLIKIFSRDEFHAWLEAPAAKDQVHLALQTVKEAGMAMEISSAGLRKMCQEIYPCPQIMALAAQLQLPISFASDAHCAQQVGADFDLLAEYAANFGFKRHVVYFDGEFHSFSF